ncbi:uncharacterized protein LOC116371885 [Oncorhynchus kisutch]|uniref:uncharacterized protein LOC116371885 n=1 Tax=Oncorhynchus kisutch TaxID=8019 RepID=UPI0012DC4990|nr:uncharacterized protein LOC116371885 [Oncorhynchus kisutch]
MDPLGTNHKDEKDTAFITVEDEKDEKDDSETTVIDGEEESDDKAKETEPQQQKEQAWAPTTYSKFGKEVFCYVGEEISIFEALDSYGAVTWPAALALCHYLETNVEQLNLVDKAVLELGAGPGLVSIVATLLGAWVTATDLPEIIGNLRANLLRNTRGRCRNTPQAAALSWGPDVERIYPRSVYRYDYVLAADVVYHHDYLEELLFTMRYFCRPGTTLIWANKVRLKTDLSFTENFQNTFNTTLLAEIGEVNILMGTCRETEEKPELDPGKQQEEEEEPELDPGKQQEEEEEPELDPGKQQEEGKEPELDPGKQQEEEEEEPELDPGKQQEEEEPELVPGKQQEEEEEPELDPGKQQEEEEEPELDSGKLQEEEEPQLDPGKQQEEEEEPELDSGKLQEEEEPQLDPGKQQEEEEEPELVPGKQQEEEEEEHVCLQVGENGLEEKEEEFEADQTTENEEEDETQKEGLKEENKDRENQVDSQVCRDDEEQQNSAGSRSTSESELEGLEEADTQDSNVQREERPVWVEQFVVEADKRSEEQDNSLEEEADAADGSSQAWEKQTLEHSDEGYGDDDDAENTNSRCSTEATDEDIEELDTKDTGDAQLDNTHVPWIRLDREVYFYAGHKINIVEAMDSHGGVIWPAALALCNYLETNTDVIDLKGKQVLELGSGTGLVSIVASLLGAQVTATDLPDVLSNLRYNLLRNTRGRSKYTPEVTALSWGPEVERTYPRSVYRYDYVLAADVVYHHDLEELLVTMKYFCRPGNTLIWANKVRLKTNLVFTEDFKNTFNTTLLAEMGEVKIFKATCKR